MHPDDKIIITDSFNELMDHILRQRNGIPKTRIIANLNGAYQWFLLLMDEEQPFPIEVSLSHNVLEEWKNRESEIEKLRNSVE